MKPRIVFLEGPAYAGKTTFLKRLDPDLFALREEASEFLGGDGNFPDAPTDTASMLYCSYFFAHMERLRLSGLPATKLTVADRFTPLSSLVFYYLRYQGGYIDEEEYFIGITLSSQIFLESLRMVENVQYNFLLFALSSEEVFGKRLARGTRNEDFNSWHNFVLLGNFYKELLPAGTETVIDGSYDSKRLPGLKYSGAHTVGRLLHPSNFLPDMPVFEALKKSDTIARSTDYVSADSKVLIEKRVEGLVYGR